MKKKRKGLKILLITFGTFAVVAAGFLWFLLFGQGVKNSLIQPIDISKVPDGTYKGNYSGGRFGNKLEAIISNGEITDIKIIKDMTISVPGVADKIFKKVEQNQTLVVDTVSGATVSSKAYLMALENALSGK